MSARLVPKYISVAGWEVWNAYAAFLEDDDLDRLRDAVGALRDALLRDPASLAEAPAAVILDYFGDSSSATTTGCAGLPESDPPVVGGLLEQQQGGGGG